MSHVVFGGPTADGRRSEVVSHQRKPVLQKQHDEKEVFKNMLLNNLPQREEFLRKKRRKRIIKYFIALGILIAVIAVASYVSYRPSIRISKVELSGGILVKETVVAEKTLEHLRGSYFWLFPKNNSFWYPRESLKKFLKDNFKRIDTVDLNLKNFRLLSVTITERKPAAIWCEGLPSEVLTSESGEILGAPAQMCFFIDQNSTIFDNAPHFSGDAYFKYYGLIKEKTPIGLEYIASTTLFADIALFVESTKSLLLHPQYVIAKDNNEFSLVISGGVEIYFDTKKPLTQVFDNLETLLSNPPLSKGLSNLEYIDLRYGNKLFYKLK